MDPVTTLEDWLFSGSALSRAAYNGWVERGGFLARVELHPATDAWMQGDRYGEVLRLTRTGRAYVIMDRSARSLTVLRSNISGVVST